MNENDTTSHNEVKKLLNDKGNTSRKNPLPKDIGTLHYDCKSNLLGVFKSNLVKSLLVW